MLPKSIVLAFGSGLQVPQSAAKPKGFGASLPGVEHPQSGQLPTGTGEGPGPCAHPIAVASRTVAMRRLQGDPRLCSLTSLSQSGPLPRG